MSIATGMATGALLGTSVPVIGNIAGAAVGTVVGIGYYVATEVFTIKGKSVSEWIAHGG